MCNSEILFCLVDKYKNTTVAKLAKLAKPIYLINRYNYILLTNILFTNSGKKRAVLSTLNIAIIGKTVIIMPGNDYMVKQLNLQKLTGTFNLLGKFPVLFTGIGVSRRMIMN